MSDHSGLKRMAENATEGPWFWEEDERPGVIKKWGIYAGEDECMPVVSHFTAIEKSADAFFIAAANPAAVLALIAELERLSAQIRLAGVAAEMAVHDTAGRAVTEYLVVAQERDQLKAEVEELRNEIAALKPSLIRTDKTTIGYTGCIICGQYTNHGGLQCPNLAFRSLSIDPPTKPVPPSPILMSIHGYPVDGNGKYLERKDVKP